MGGFFGWFLVLVLVLAVFNAEKLPALKEMLEEKFKDSIDVAKEGSKLAKDKIKKIKEDNAMKRSEASKAEEPEENTPEEIEDALQFMGEFIDKKKSPDKKVVAVRKKDALAEALTEQKTAGKPADARVDLEQNYK